MRYSDLFLKTAPAFAPPAGRATAGKGGDESVNARMLQRGGFIDKTMAGVYTYLPLGLRVLRNIEDVVREEMNAIATEVMMPSLSPPSLWETTGRLEKIDVLFAASAANELSRERNDAAYIMNATHEELVVPMAQKIKLSYKDFPFAVYQIQTKFRNEERPKSGLLRGREFRMKDLYSFHTDEADFKRYYEKAKEVYMRVFERVGLGSDTHITLASGGAFTKEFSYEFDTKCETGEDTIFYDTQTDTYYNKEVVTPEIAERAQSFKASEVGNIFPLGTRFTSAFNYTYLDATGKHQPIYMGCYGLGTSRVLGVLVEKFHDEKGIIWPKSVAPFDVYVIGLKRDAREIVAALEQAGKTVLYDDREEASAGQKFADADLIGIPARVVVSKKTGDNVEIKWRDGQEIKLISLPQLIKQL